MNTEDYRDFPMRRANPEHVLMRPEQVPVQVLIRTIKNLMKAEDPRITEALQYAYQNALDGVIDEQRREKRYQHNYQRTRR